MRFFLFNNKNTRLFFLIVEKDFNIVNEKIETILSDQFYTIVKCSTCKNNEFSLVTNECPLIDLRKTRFSKELKN